jgi:PAS domain S-box-containing protein
MRLSMPMGRDLASASGLYLLCLAGAAGTEWLTRLPDAAISIWVSTGFLFAAALASPYRRWPLLAIAMAGAELTGNALWYGHDWGPALLFACGNLLAGLTAAFLVRTGGGDPPYLGSVRSTVFLLIIVVLAMPVISATIGSVALGWSYGRPPFAALGRILLGDATGAVVAVPLGLLALGLAAPPLGLHRRRREIGLLATGFAAMAFVSLGGLLPFAFLMIVPLLWAALRLRMPGAIAANAILLTVTIVSTWLKIGPFASGAAYPGFAGEGLQLFILAASVSALLVGAIAEENRLAVRRLREANRTLEDRVEERSASLVASEGRARETANLLSAIGEASPDLIFAKGCDHRFIYANRATLDALGLESLDARPPDDAELFAEPEEYAAIRRIDEQVLATRETAIAEEIFTDANGARRIFRSTKAPLYDHDGQLTGLASVSVDITDLKRSEARERMLVREVEHRSRNLLAVVQGILALTRAETVEDYRANVQRRINALARTNSAIVAGTWEVTSLHAILGDELAPYDDGRVAIEGEDVSLDRAAAQSLTLIVHELATNAAKYGSLSVADGRLDIGWTVEATDGGKRLLRIDWRESGGPPVVAPARGGFGTRVVSAFSAERSGGGVDFDWRAEGLWVRLRLPLLAESAAAGETAPADPV